MTSLSSTPRTGHRAGFTLTELLIVITIIGILASTLLTVFTSVQNRARKVQAVNDMRNINIAVLAYYADYHKYPLNTSQQPVGQPPTGDAVYGAPGGGGTSYPIASLFDILLAVPDNNNSNNAANPSQNVYWSGKYAANAAKPREGLTPSAVTVNGVTLPKNSLVDPWGSSYIVYIDADQDGDLSTVIGQNYTDAGTVKVGGIPLGVAYASLGPDGLLGSKKSPGVLANSDDIASWKQ